MRVEAFSYTLSKLRIFPEAMLAHLSGLHGPQTAVNP